MGVDAVNQKHKLTYTEEWEQRVGVSHESPNFEVLVKEALSNSDEEESNAALILLGLKKPPRTVIPFDGSFIPDWVERDS